MECVLCHTEVNLLDLDAEGYGGLPAHTVCARAQRQAIKDALDEAHRMIANEPDPRRHRRHAAA